MKSVILSLVLQRILTLLYWNKDANFQYWRSVNSSVLSWHKHLGWEKSYMFWIFRTTDGKTKTQINYIFFKDDKIWKYVSDKYDSRQIALPESTRAILRLPFCKCTFECFYCFHFLYLTEEQIKNFGSHRQVHFPYRRNLTEAHRILKHDAHCNLVSFLC